MPADIALAFLVPLTYWGLVLRNIRQLRKTQRGAPSLKPEKGEERPLQMGWHIVIAGWFVQPAMLFIWPEPPRLFAPFPPLQEPAADAAGVFLALAGLAGTLWCHHAMGTHWQLWIKESEPAHLIQSGPYRRIRHPIYMFQILCLAATWILLPSLFLAGVLMLHAFCIHRKAIGEEQHFLRQLGSLYGEYMKRTGRFFPHFR